MDCVFIAVVVQNPGASLTTWVIFATATIWSATTMRAVIGGGGWRW